MQLPILYSICVIFVLVFSTVVSVIFFLLVKVNIILTFALVLIGSSGVSFVIIFLFRKYFENVLNTVNKALKNELKDMTVLEDDKLFLEITETIKMERKRLSANITLETKDFFGFANDLKEVKTTFDSERENNDRIQKEIRDIKEYLYGNTKIFDKIKAIGMEIKNTSQNIDKETQDVLKDAKEQTAMASSGVKTIGDEIKNINELKTSIMSSTKLIEELIDMSKRIKNFVVTIADMTKKTNLLALNAGIEAARAGEAGKSFSVVAEQIKVLAANSNMAAEEITQILQNIQVRTAEVIEIIKITEKLEANIATFYKTGDMFIQIVKDVKHIEKIINNISLYTDEHFTDSELLFKIINDTSMNIMDYLKLVDKMNLDIEEVMRNNFNIYSKIEKTIATFDKTLKEKMITERGMI